MAFKALNCAVIQELSLDRDSINNAFQSAFFVFSIQTTMISFIIALIMKPNFVIIIPSDFKCSLMRFVCSILMHLMVEAEIR